MTIAESIKNYYLDNSDFEDAYIFAMCEDSSSIEFQIFEVIKSPEFYDLTKGIFDGQTLTNNGLDYLSQYIFDNANELYQRYTSYYVGAMCLASCPFGEQCEELTGLHNSRTGKNYTLPYLKRCFETADFCILDNYAYYNMSDDGIYINMQSIPSETIFEAFNTK